MNHKLCTCILCVAVLLTQFLFPVVACGESYVVATDYWPPFRVKNGDEMIGIDIDLMRTVGERMGVEFVFRVMPWARCLLSMEKGDVDMMSGLAWTRERARHIRYSSLPYYTCAPAFYERKSRKGPPIRNYEDLMHVEVAYTRDSAYFEPFDSDLRLDKVAVTSEAQLVRMVEEGRLDVFIGTDCQVDYDLVQRGLERKIVKTSFQPQDRIELYLGVSRRSPLRHRLDELNAVLEELVENGTVRRIADRYLKKRSPSSR